MSLGGRKQHGAIQLLPRPREEPENTLPMYDPVLRGLEAIRPG